jgi:glycine/D-amino acid oxidase-like deaminating enzyme
VRLGERGVTLLTDGPTLEAGQVVLCTNGFNMLELRNEVGPDIVTADHALVHGVIGYMGGYLRDAEAKASAISYFGPTRSHLDAYAYVTRRPFERSRRGPRELLCVGGPERPLPSCAGYDAHTAFPGGIAEEMDRFLMDTVVDAQQSERAFLWHGLMGYTPSGVRCIGAEPKNPILLYNLGCNGVGILPSVYGGQRIAQLIAGLRLPASMFDPVA